MGVLNRCLTLKLGTAWKVEPPEGKAVTSVFVCQGVGIPSEQFLY